ncbi:MAG: hypothetical protein COZ31_04050 [Nitrospirae bacterium CG_4_10_14_3_um_filter_44_29]|nr:MAG: hypothetical protein AUJ60_07855 [Nitrospirae bacterium CG1_02_44_142]PIP70585.1 MAG: hypothetical protein COW90_04585 [Nitrospirae bacterium CG22_combo_CG10-13_8_21_14_all_44_11]PIV40432.1 MAG: hypothetical protein COS28_08925 [Nitrospirae bacterium CG02_land_8_20_14_3_00_44_33]PIV66534.1 MAG: hypothetical protein COS10_05745 [Nitrospirae bacterium CG01_land_8_20_14_3_00_44_22]PIW88576.1 MAG: hypothetical protein COZ93_09675 [Nitrospirae bacterium CG_4_8_14_3_um_filter_44_28]PIX89059.
MENVYTMKNSVFIAIVFFVMSVSVLAQPKTDVNMRASKQDGVLRLVFEAEEAFIKNTNAAVSGTQLMIEFPSAFNIISMKGAALDTSMKEGIFAVNFKETFNIKVMRLSSPARFVIDIAPKAAADIKPWSDGMSAQKIYVIDPGHGGYDFGASVGNFKEKDIVLSIAKGIENLLAKKGKKVFLTRKSDQFMSIRDRALFANQKMAEIFVSIHVSSAEGFTLYVPIIGDAGYEPTAALYALSLRQQKYLHKSRVLAEGISRAIKEEFNLNAALREMPLPILNSAAAPAVLIEIPSFKVMNYDQNTRARLAEAIVKGFSYYGQ